MRRSTEADHPPDETLDQLAEGRWEEGEAPDEHLEEGCIPCATRLRPRLGHAMPGLGRLVRRAILDDEELSDEERRELAARGRAWRALGAAERRSAPELFGVLLAHPAPERREAIRRSARFASRGLVLHLVEAARKEGFRDPFQALELARLGLEVAEALEEAGFPHSIAADARALAWASIANAHRIPGELVEAERAMDSSRRLLSEGSGDPGTRAEVLSLMGSLRIDEARFDEAVEVLREAARIYRAYGDRAAEAKVLMQLGNASGERGETEEAVAFLAAARERLGDDAPGELDLLAAQSLLGWLVAAGKAEEARAVLGEMEQATREREMSFYLRQRVRWAKARLLWAEGDRERAEEELRQVREAYRENDEIYRMSLLSLDLALLFLEEDRTSEVRKLAEEMLPVFSSRELHHNALQALAIFQRAAETDTATAALVQDLARYLRRAANNPYLVYEPAG